MERKQRPQASQGARNAGAKSLAEAVTEIDQEILRLLLKRHNLLEKIRHKGRLDAADERIMREAWQANVAKVSRDAELATRFFSLLQQISFLPRPGAKPADSQPGAERREAFNLAPPRSPIQAEFICPLDQRQSCSWLYLAACAGAPLRIGPCLQNDALIDCIKALVQLGGAITRDGEDIVARNAAPVGAPDKVIHVGQDHYLLYLMVAHYLGRPSRVKLTGDADLHLTDLSFLRNLLPGLGARFINVVPKSSGLPARIESSGILPNGIVLPSDAPALFAQALLMAAPFYAAPFAVDLGKLKERENILARALPVLEAAGAVFSVQGSTISLDPSSPAIPEKPQIALDGELASFLLGIAATLGGNIRLSGIWPDWPSIEPVNRIFTDLQWQRSGRGVELNASAALQNFDAAKIECFAEWQDALACALACASALHGGFAKISQACAAKATSQDLATICGLRVAEDGKIEPGTPYTGPGWTAPTAAWGMALALVACARKQGSVMALTNPGIVTELWPLFWVFYNSLPRPEFKKRQKPAEPAKERRRVITGAVAVPPKLKQEDWE